MKNKIENELDNIIYDLHIAPLSQTEIDIMYDLTIISVYHEVKDKNT